MSFLHQFYSIPDDVTNESVEHEVISKFYYTKGLNAGYSYGFQIQKTEYVGYFYASTNAQSFPQQKEYSGPGWFSQFTDKSIRYNSSWLKAYERYCR